MENARDTTGEMARGVTRLGNRFVNWWLITDEEGVVVVDAGLPGHLAQLERGLRDQGLSLQDVDACLLTHADIDHIGVAEALRQQSGTDVLIHPDDEPGARGLVRALPKELIVNLWRPYLRQTATAYRKDGALRPRFLSATSPLQHGERLDIPGRPLVIHCPGHTVGSCAFYFLERDLLFTGDALVTINILTGAPGPQLLPAFDNHDHLQAAASLERLLDTEAAVVLPGHGEVWTGGIAAAVRDARGMAV